MIEDWLAYYNAHPIAGIVTVTALVLAALAGIVWDLACRRWYDTWRRIGE